MMKKSRWQTLFLLPFIATSTFASETVSADTFNFTQTTVGYAALVIFGIAYTLVMMEEYLQLRKSKPVLLAAGLIWIIIGLVYKDLGQIEVASLR